MQYDEIGFDHVDWSFRGEHMMVRHGITPAMAGDALADPDRVVISPDYNSASGRSDRTIGYCRVADVLVSVITLVHHGVRYGVNGWASNDRDRRIYREIPGGDYDG